MNDSNSTNSPTPDGGDGTNGGGPGVELSRWLLNYLGFPALALLGKVFPGGREKLEAYFIKINNRMVSSRLNGFSIRSLLLLLPHCLQFDGCEHKITKRILNCAGCGKCRVVDIVRLGEKYNVPVKVATGGRLARRLVDEIKPDVVVAVACERELSEGISATYPAFVMGIPNIRPFGPCVNTTVEAGKIESVIEKILGGKSDGPAGVRAGGRRGGN